MACNLFAQQPTEEWVRNISWGTKATGQSIKIDNSGNLYVMFEARTDSTALDFGIAKYTASGIPLWLNSYNSPGLVSERPIGFDVSFSGDVYIAGYSGINFIYKIVVAKFDSSGVLRWHKEYDNGGLGAIPQCINVDGNGDVIVSGGATTGVGQGKGVLLKYAPNGDSIWVRILNMVPYLNNIQSVVLDKTNYIYAAGYYRQTNTDFLATKFNPEGILQWYTTYDSPDHYGDMADYIAIDSLGNLYVVGTNDVPPYATFNTLVKFYNNGSIQWASTFKGLLGNIASCEDPAGIGITEDGNFIYYTTFCDNNTSYEIVTLKYDSNGDSVWVRRLGGGTDYSHGNHPKDLMLDHFGNCYITGEEYSSTSGYRGVTTKYLTNGSIQWRAIFAEGGVGQGMSIDSGLSVYVTGGALVKSIPIAVTIKYNQPIGIVNNNRELPTQYRLFQNYPNPFNGSTIITYEVPIKSSVSLKLYNSLGQEVRTLVNNEQSAGYYSMQLNIENLPSGIYFYQLISENKYYETRKMILVK